MVDENTTDWTLEQAARVLGKSDRTIRRLIQDGILNGYKVPGQKHDEWRIKPVKMTETQDEDDRDLGQLLKDKDQDLVARTGHLEVLLSETQKRAEQADQDRLETQLTLEYTNKQLAQMGDLLHSAEDGRNLANKERDAAIKEAAELKEQVQTLTAQVSDLLSQLAHLPVEQPITAPLQDITPATEEPCHASEHPVVSPEQTRTVKLILHVKAKNAMHCPIGHPMQSRENIEKAVLSRFGMKQLSNKQGSWESTGEYELLFSDNAGLHQQIADMCRECEQEASKLKCNAKCEIKS